MNIDTIIFDLGGVLIDWNPRYMYSSIFRSSEAMNHFLRHVCTSEWNEEQDGGRSIAEATRELTALHPQYRSEIEAFYGRWTGMLGGPIEETVAILKTLHQNSNHRLIALTNWSAETWPEATARYSFLQLFEGILVSGVEKLKKPDPAIYRLLLERYEIDISTAVFIDDNARNVAAARALGLRSIQFENSNQLHQDLRSIGCL